MYEATLEQLAYHNLERHSLIDRAPAVDAIRVIEEICGLNAQGALNYNLSLWSRVEGLDNQFIRDSMRNKTLLRSWFMRNTVHIMTTRQAFIVRPALRESLVQEWDRWTVKTGSKLSPDSWMVHYDQVLAALADGPLAMNELRKTQPRVRQPKAYPQQDCEGDEPEGPRMQRRAKGTVVP